MKEQEPYNPGLSEEAWEKLHKLVARLSVKYANNPKEKESSDSDVNRNKWQIQGSSSMGEALLL